MPEFITLFGNPDEKPEQTPEPEEKRGFFGRMREAVARTRESFSSRIGGIVALTRVVDEAALEDLETALLTSDIARRAFEHREGRIDGFTRRYGLKRLVLTEFYEDIRDAIQRESNIKHWPHAWKVRLIHAANPEWRDLYEDMNA